MTGWHLRPFAAFDLETTGVDVDTARVVTATVVQLDGPSVFESAWLVNPGVDIPAEATAVHGVTTEQAAAEGLEASFAVTKIAAMLRDLFARGVPVVAFNACYDFTVLDRECHRHGVEPVTARPVIDPLVIDRHVDRYRRGRRNLAAACVAYGVRQDDAHSSTGDALAAARVAWAIASRLPHIGGADPGELHDQQARWHADWAAGFEAYLRTQGKAEVIDRAWPVRPLVAERVA